MIDLVFLGARLPLTKTFVHEHGRTVSTPYPHVSRVTSYHEQVSDLPGFAAQLEAHAAQQHCLFGGQLACPLDNESRAGKTLDAKRSWVVFDFDKVEGADHKDVVAKYLPAECQNVSYVAQLSASMFRPDTTTWSGHIFMLLSSPADQMHIKQWFEHINFTVPALTGQITLSDSLQALHWPLDRTVAYNSKLIYIAPPKCIGFTPAVKQHIVHVKKKQQTLTIPAFTPVDTFTIRHKINELRRAVGVDEIEYRLTVFEGHEMLVKTDVCDVQGIKNSGDHYIRFNLNGGDSYAYFIDLRNPEIIRNFKGEPYLKTADAAPDLYKALRKSASVAIAREPLEAGSEVLAFFATNRDGRIKTGVYNGESRSLRLDNATVISAKNWLSEHGIFNQPLVHRDLVFNPHQLDGYVPGSTTINMFSATDYMKREKSSDAASSLKDLPPVLNKCLRSVLGPCEEAVVEHFMNWLAYVFQYRDKAQTAWVLSGVEGTGKNTLMNHYLRPILGSEHVQSIQYPNLAKEFNGFLEKALLVVVEEADLKAVENVDELGSKLRHYITDSPLMIRRMNTDHTQMENYSSFILFTNKKASAPVSSTDRRFNFGEWQEARWIPTPNEVRIFSEGSELDAFADVLARWPVDVMAVRKVVETQARRDSYEASITINQLVAEALGKGDLQFFVERMPTDAEAMGDFNNRFNPLPMFKQLIAKYQEDAQAKRESIVTEEDAFVLFRTLITDSRYFQDSKTWRKRHYKSFDLDFDKQHRVGSRRVRGIRMQWYPADHDSMPAREDAVDNVTQITKGKKK